MYNVKVDGSVGNKIMTSYKFHPTHKIKYWKSESINYKKIDNKFSPNKRKKYIDIKTAYELVKQDNNQKNKVIHFQKYLKLNEIFNKYGIENKITCFQEYPSKNIYVYSILMNRNSGQELYEEIVPLNVPCLLHDRKKDEERVERLKKEGYVEKIKITKIKKEMNEWLSKNIKNHEFELSFSGNSLFVFNQIKISFWNSVNSGFKTGESNPIKYYDSE